MREIANLSESARNIAAFGAGADGNVYALPRKGAMLRLDLKLADNPPNASPGE